jgi:cell division protein FtsI/penicillin-binding protein 2
MVGMARRGSHSARHRAGRLSSDAPGQGSARGGLAGTGLAEPGRVEPERVEPERVEPERVEPELVEPERIEPELAVVAPEETGGQGVVATAAAGGVRRAEPGLEPDDGVPAPGAGARRPGTPPRRPGRPAAKPGKSGRRKRLTSKTILLTFAAVALIITGMISIGPTGASVAQSVRTFLYDWETGNYSGAAALTTGNQAVVKRALRAAFRQLGAEDLVLGMGPITAGTSTATAYFNATVDLGRGLLPWQYRGHLRLRRLGSSWLVVWSPSVITPGLGPRDRLVVVTTMPGRASLVDASGQPLFRLSRVYEVGVVPGKVTHPAVTSAELARATGLPVSDVDQMRGLIEASPPHEFLGLIQLSRVRFQRIRGKLSEIQGFDFVVAHRRLFDSAVPDVTGQIGTETSLVIAKQGEPYRPGTTVGESGLEQEYQAQLAGTPTTEVVVQDRAGKQVRVLHRWPGQRGTQVRTTIEDGIQWAAQQAVAGLHSSAAIVATRAGGGQILAVASRQWGALPAVSPLDGQYQPAQTFTIVSTAAALSWTPGFAVSSPLPCKATNPIGGQTFSTDARPGRSPRFSADFKLACDTAFAGLSLRVTSSALMNAAKGFGIGGPTWRLPLPKPAFDGSIVNPGSNLGDKAADMVGRGSVRVSPLDMALVAGVADSGTWLAPTLVSQPGRKPATRVAFGRVIGQIQHLMRAAVVSGAAGAANRPGAAIYGQVGSVSLAGHHKLYANWFVGFRGNVSFAVLVISTSQGPAGFDQAASIAGQFASTLPPGSFGRG